MIEIIAEIVKQNVTTEKVFLCPDTAAAKFIGRRLVGNGPGFANLKFESVASFIGRAFGFNLIAKEGRVLKPGEGVLILQNLVRSDGYFGGTLDMPGFLQSLWKSIQNLRLAQIYPDELTAEIFGSESKAEELSHILEKFMLHINDNNLYDYTRILKECRFEKALADKSTLILLPGNLPLMPLELEILQTAGKNLLHLPWSSIAEIKAPVSWRARSAEKSLPASEVDPSHSCCLPASTQLEFFCATEPAAEVREIVRRIRSAEVDFEQVAIVPADLAYASLICSQLDADRVPHANSLPRKINEFRPGRLALNLCQWAAEGFPAEGLIAMLNQGDLRLFRPLNAKQRQAKKRYISSQTVINRLRQAHVRGGRSGYQAPLLAIGESMSSSGKIHKLHECRRIAKRIASLIDAFAEVMTPAQSAAALLKILSRHLRITTVQDSQRFSKIKKALQRYPDFSHPEMPLPKAMWWLTIVLSQLGEGENFRPDGRVLITSPLAAAISGRKILFFPGMTHAAIPGKPSVDPVIADSCRKNLPPLKTAAEIRRENLGQLYSAWSQIGPDKRVCLSLPMVDNAAAATSPSECFTRALRQKIGTVREFSRLIGSAELPLVGHFVAAPHEPIDISEWLWRHLKQGVGIESLKNLFETAYPSWREYHNAQKARTGRENYVCRGIPGWDKKLWDYRDNPELALSASGIEELGGCPFAWFMNYVLNCMPAEQIDTADQQQAAWLDALSRGKLLHEIYENFMLRAGWPIKETQQALLEEVVDELAEKYRTIIPPASYSAFIFGKEAIKRDAFAFFQREYEAAATGSAKPIGFELSFGLPLNPDVKSQSGLDQAEPVPFTLSSGSRVNLKGRLDRIDEDVDGIRIWDYKTGSARSYQPGGDRHDQALLQLAVYKYAVSKILADKGDKRKVAGSGLYFPTISGQGQRIVFDGTEEKDIIETRLDGLFDFLVKGSFTPDLFCEECNALNICPYAGLTSESALNQGEEEQ